jgi:hypothetical protein
MSVREDGWRRWGKCCRSELQVAYKTRKRRIKKARKGKKKGGGGRGMSAPPSSKGNHRRIWKGRSSKGTREKSAPYKAFFG